MDRSVGRLNEWISLCCWDIHKDPAHSSAWSIIVLLTYILLRCAFPSLCIFSFLLLSFYQVVDSSVQLCFLFMTSQLCYYYYRITSSVYFTHYFCPTHLFTQLVVFMSVLSLFSLYPLVSVLTIVLFVLSSSLSTTYRLDRVFYRSAALPQLALYWSSW